MTIYSFVANSILLGIGLAMDAFSVSIANGLHDPKMKDENKIKIAGTFACFQFLMPMLGWMFVHFVLESFEKFQICIPWIAIALLLYIGGKMIYEAITDAGCNDYSSISSDNENEENASAGRNSEVEDSDNKIAISRHELLIQGIATSIDALSVGFTIADYKVHMAFICSVIIALVTFLICEVGLKIGIKVGTKLAKKASVLGGLILIFIGIEIFVKGVIL